MSVIKLPFLYIKRDFILKNGFSQSNFNLTKKPLCYLNTNLNRGIYAKKDLIIAGFFLSIITGQKPVSVHAKKPSALFKNRKNELLGWKVTLRNFKFNIFFDKFYLFVQSQESTEFKIKNLSSVIEFNKIVIPLNMEIHLIK